MQTTKPRIPLNLFIKIGQISVIVKVAEDRHYWNFLWGCRHGDAHRIDAYNYGSSRNVNCTWPTSAVSGSHLQTSSLVLHVDWTQNPPPAPVKCIDYFNLLHSNALDKRCQRILVVYSKCYSELSAAGENQTKSLRIIWANFFVAWWQIRLVAVLRLGINYGQIDHTHVVLS